MQHARQLCHVPHNRSQQPIFLQFPSHVSRNVFVAGWFVRKKQKKATI